MNIYKNKKMEEISIFMLWEQGVPCSNPGIPTVKNKALTEM